MTDPKEVADLVARLRAICDPTSEAMSDGTRLTMFVRAGDDAATTLEALSSELERVKGERDALARAVNKFAFERDSAEASLGVAVKALASAADAAKSFRDESGDAVAEQVLLRISPALASIQAKGV
jgi:hypothetical protein